MDEPTLRPITDDERAHARTCLPWYAQDVLLQANTVAVQCVRVTAATRLHIVPHAAPDIALQLDDDHLLYLLRPDPAVLNHHLELVRLPAGPVFQVRALGEPLTEADIADLVDIEEERLPDDGEILDNTPLADLPEILRPRPETALPTFDPATLPPTIHPSLQPYLLRPNALPIGVACLLLFFAAAVWVGGPPRASTGWWFTLAVGTWIAFFKYAVYRKQRQDSARRDTLLRHATSVLATATPITQPITVWRESSTDVTYHVRIPTVVAWRADLPHEIEILPPSPPFRACTRLPGTPLGYALYYRGPATLFTHPDNTLVLATPHTHLLHLP